MRVTAPARRSIFSSGERETLAAVARASMPAGRVFRGAGVDCVDKIDNFMALGPPAVAQAYRGLIWALDAAALLHHRRRLKSLGDAEVLSLLERWRHADYGRRTMLRLLTLPLKMAHFNDAAMYATVGCKFGTLPIASGAVEKPRYLSERVMPAADVPANETLECDVVVIGTGAGGAVAARELAERGCAVVMLEEGEYFTRADFTGHAAEMQRKLYRDMGATIAVGNASIPIPIGKTVGGTTTINSGTCYRAPARIFESWRDKHGLADFSAEHMAPYYERVEEVLGVAETEARYVGGVGRVIARGCDALGYKHKALRRNAPACDGQGLCCFGCPTDAKRSTNVSYVPLALKAGAQLITGARADRILTDGGRATGVEVRAGKQRFTVRARAVVVACGSLLTPLLLERSKLGTSSGELGKNLSIHPAVAALALYDEVIDGTNAVPQGYSIEEFHDEGILFEGAFAPLDIGAAQSPLLGAKLVELLEDYKRLACFGFMIEDTSRGRVRPGPGGRPLITYWMNRHDVARLKRGVEILSRVYLAGGARFVMPQVNGFDQLRGEADLERFRRAKVSARDFEISAYHPLGTARMGRDPRRSVVGADQQVHDAPGLYVMDGSAVPTSPAVNPQMTIMALATRASQRLADRLG